MSLLPLRSAWDCAASAACAVFVDLKHKFGAVSTPAAAAVEPSGES
jgi:hypothetical protein